ncbi:hypothetical protein KJ059_10090 [Myxococcota bacterium]|nr:hypothetical protein [Myxococcota bacterium]
MHARAKGTSSSIACWGAVLLATTALWGLPVPASAFDFFDGRLQVHGFYEQQVRAVGRNLDPGNGIALAQWYHVLNLEIEADLAPDGLGPLEIVEFFARIEGRYDCVWTHACQLSSGVETFGNEARWFPRRLIDGRNAGFTGSLENGDQRRFAALDRENFSLEDRNEPQNNLRRPLRLSSLPGLVSLFGNSDGPNGTFEPLLGSTGDDPAPFHLARLLEDCRFGVQQLKGGEGGELTRILGPWTPKCRIEPIGALRKNPNPWSFRDFNPILAGVDRIPGTADDPDNANAASPIDTLVPRGRGALPFRPAPFFGVEDPAPRGEAQGLFYPSAGLRRALQRDLDSIDQNFSQTELAFNRGASQSDEKELKEAYLDLEAAGGRLWLRLGKQSIVWGKTELFRNTDQFNPQDLALSSLPTLEESRIALWAARGSWSFYNIGKLEDVRLELATNLDNFEGADLGRCGEPFAFDLVCNLTFGYFAHGLFGAGLAGVDRPSTSFDDLSGVEFGARVEFRYRRFSFQISDFYGFDDFPSPERISSFERNVDPFTGMPRRADARGSCTTGDSRVEGDCLGRGEATVLLDATGNPLRARDWDHNGIPDDVDGDGTPDILSRNETEIARRRGYLSGELIPTPETLRDVIANHPANQTLFAFSNALTVGAAGIDTDGALAGFGSFNGKEGPAPIFSTVAQGASGLLAASRAAFDNAAATGFMPPSIVLRNSLARLHLQPGDATGPFSDGGVGPFAGSTQALGQFLTPQQEALLGCGPFWYSDCDDDGIDLLNAEASVLLQAWPGFDGTTGSVFTHRSDVGPQPGTLAFASAIGSGPVATRFVDGRLVRLPGARGVVDEQGVPDPFYDPTVDGCTHDTGSPLCAGANVAHPLTGDPFRTELAAVSWNLLMIIAARSDPVDPNLPSLVEFSARDPNGFGIIQGGPNAGMLRPGVDAAAVDGVTPVACGVLSPQLCQTVQGFLTAAGTSRKSVRAGGNGVYGRRDFAWHSSGEFVLRYEKRNILGFAFDVAEDRTKTNWGVEMTWVEGQPFLDNDEPEGVSRSDTFNLTVSVDRPTFINFLNPNRTVFFNSQWFFQYIEGHEDGFTTNGPLNVLATLTALTGYHQDRLLIAFTTVYDFRSRSGGLLPQVSYRFTENFSATVGSSLFFGRVELTDAPISEVRAGLNRTGELADKDPVENGLSPLRERDELFLTLRYTF